MEGDTEKISLETDKKHMLNSEWIVWYHNPISLGQLTVTKIY